MKKLLIVAITGILLLSGATAISFDTALDLSCSFASFLNPACGAILYDDIVQASPDEVQSDIYLKGEIYRDAREQAVREHLSHINQTHGMAMSKAKLTIIEELNNGSSRAEAKEKALDVVDEFYSQQLKSLINEKNRVALKFNSTIIQTIRETSGLTPDRVVSTDRHHPNVRDSYGYADCGFRVDEVRWNFDGFKYMEKNMTLWDNETVELYGIAGQFHRHAINYQDWRGDFHYHCREWNMLTPLDFQGGPNNYDHFSLMVNNGDGNHTMMLRTRNYTRIYNKIKSSRQRARDNVIKLGNQVYENYEPNQVNVQNVLGPLEELQLASTKYNSTGYYSYLAVSLEQMGLATNDSYAFKVKWWNKEAEPKTAFGQLFATNSSFDGKIVAGKNYSAEDRTVWFVHQTSSGEATTTQFNGKFRVLQMTDKNTGQQINSTTLQSTEFRTASAEDLKAQLETIRENQKELQADLGGGIGKDVQNWLNQLISNLGLPIPKINQGTMVVGGALVLLLLIIAV